jgi:hypothetical protein
MYEWVDKTEGRPTGVNGSCFAWPSTLRRVEVKKIYQHISENRSKCIHKTGPSKSMERGECKNGLRVNQNNTSVARQEYVNH